MAREQFPHALCIVAVHLRGHIDEAVALQVAGCVQQLLGGLLLRRNRLQVDHRKIAALGEVAGFIQHIGHTTRHARREVAARLADDENHATRHVFAAVVAHALDDGDSAGVAHGETLARNTAQVALAGDRTIEHRVAGDDRVLGLEADLLMRADDELGSREALADIVVGLTGQFQRDALRTPCAEALPGNAGQLHHDGVFRQARMAVTLGNFA